MSLVLQPVFWREACQMVRLWHRHLPPSRGWLFGIAVNDAGRICGVICVGRPVARGLQDGWTCEATRCATDGTKNAASMLYAAAWRAARAMGYRRLVTYTLPSESGASLRAACYRVVHQTRAATWTCPSRPRFDDRPAVAKTLWEGLAREEAH